MSLPLDTSTSIILQLDITGHEQSTRPIALTSDFYFSV